MSMYIHFIFNTDCDLLLHAYHGHLSQVSLKLGMYIIKSSTTRTIYYYGP